MAKIHQVISRVTNMASKILSIDTLLQGESKEKDFCEIVEQARLDWDAARSLFNDVSDPDLIDHSIYALEAAEKKYTYLLKKAREMGYKVNYNYKEEGNGGKNFGQYRL